MFAFPKRETPLLAMTYENVAGTASQAMTASNLVLRILRV
jgi:hypothetical protein